MTPSRQIEALRSRLAEAEETLRAIRSGEVDAVVVAGERGQRVFTLEGAEHAYRVLIESMNEGALTLAAGQIILYANRCFARMVQCPLAQVTGSSFRRFLSASDRVTLAALLKRGDKSGSKAQLLLNAADGSHVPVQVSVRPLARNGSRHRIIAMVVTDMTEARHNEELLRAFSHRLVQTQETERGRVALELHDNITQLLCAILLRSQLLADTLSEKDGPSKAEALKVRQLLGETAEEVERISRNLRPGVLEQLGLDAVLRDTSKLFAERTGLSVKLTLVRLGERLPADTELAFYRILQEALRNVEKHARASSVTVRLSRRQTSVLLVIQDDGIGFRPERQQAGRKTEGGLGLLGMRERASYVGGTLKVTSGRRMGTEIQVSIPVTPIALATG